MTEEYKCNKCPYHVKEYSTDLGEYVHACMYISKLTAWACYYEEKDEMDGK